MGESSSSRTMAMVADVVSRCPGHTAYWYDTHCLPGRATRGRTYEAFGRAWKRGMIRRQANPKMTGSIVYYPI